MVMGGVAGGGGGVGSAYGLLFLPQCILHWLITTKENVCDYFLSRLIVFYSFRNYSSNSNTRGNVKSGQKKIKIVENSSSSTAKLSAMPRKSSSDVDKTNPWRTVALTDDVLPVSSV